MNSVSYPDRDYAFGEAILVLRLKMGLTQAGLAQQLGISRRALGAWEGGSSYPKFAPLKKLIAFAIEAHAFTAGHEAEEVRALWQASHQKLPLDEVWLKQLLTPGPRRATPSVKAKDSLPGGDKRTFVSLPFQPTAFVGRTTELKEIDGLLDDPACRLLTLVGPGGIGKTRLAIRAAANCDDRFEDGVYFVPLQALDSPELITSAIIDVVSPQAGLGGAPKTQLLQYLRDKALLLVLDNFEHLLAGADLLTELLEAAPDIKLLVTSRQMLNLHGEWRYSILGLEYPEREEAEEPGAYSAVQLFVERARQVRRDLSLVDEQAAIVRVCRLVQGMPLALELAAAWVRTFSIKEIAIKIQRNLDFLSTSLRDVPQRHQSMLAVFEQTWEQLTDEQRRVFGAISVFSGGFYLHAAEAVANVSLRVLSDLVDKALLTREPEGRYQMHELLRQYAHARLDTLPEETIRIHDLHAAYYAHFLYERNGELNAGRQLQASLEIEAELDNIRAAWLWSVEHFRVENIEKAEHALYMFYQIQSRFPEATDTFEKAVQMLDNGDPRTEICLASVLCDLGWMFLFGSAFKEAIATLERSWLLYSRNGVLPTPGRATDPRNPLGLTYLRVANFSGAETLGEDALRDHTSREDRFNLALAWYLLASVARVQGRYAKARHDAEQAYLQAMMSGDELFAGFCLQEWGKASELLGDAEDAKRRIHASYVIRKDLGDPQGTATTLNSLGRLALLEGNNAEARRCYEEGFTVYHKIGDRGGLATSLEGLGNTAREMGHYGEARRYLSEALQYSSKLVSLRTLSVFVGIGDLLLRTGQRTRGIELLAIALHHPAGDQDTKDRAQQLLTRHQVSAEAARQISSAAEIEAVTAALPDELENLKVNTLTRQAPYTGETLIEPLSERELAVLTLIANERSNREIAEKLLLSVATVKWYLTHIYGKLNVENRTLAISRARQLNLLP